MLVLRNSTLQCTTVRITALKLGSFYGLGCFLIDLIVGNLVTLCAVIQLHLISVSQAELATALLPVLALLKVDARFGAFLTLSVMGGRVPIIHATEQRLVGCDVVIVGRIQLRFQRTQVAHVGVHVRTTERVAILKLQAGGHAKTLVREIRLQMGGLGDITVTITGVGLLGSLRKAQILRLIAAIPIGLFLHSIILARFLALLLFPPLLYISSDLCHTFLDLELLFLIALRPRILGLLFLLKVALGLCHVDSLLFLVSDLFLNILAERQGVISHRSIVKAEGQKLAMHG